MQQCQWQSLPFLKTDLANGKSSEKDLTKKKKIRPKFLPWKDTGKRLFVGCVCFRFGYTFTRHWLDTCALGGGRHPVCSPCLGSKPPLGVDCLAAKLPTQAGPCGLDGFIWRISCGGKNSPDISDKRNPVIKVVHDGFAAGTCGKVHLDYTTAK